MILYHGSLQIVPHPKILIPNRQLDYGIGFYTTTSMQQAHDWVVRKLDSGKGVGYVNIYNWDEASASTLNQLRFDSADENWLDFVMRNRTTEGFHHAYDTVYGPVANDRVYAAFALYEQHFIDKEGLIRELRTYKLVDQILFHTERALETLKFIEAKEVSL